MQMIAGLVTAQVRISTASMHSAAAMTKEILGVAHRSAKDSIEDELKHSLYALARL